MHIKHNGYISGAFVLLPHIRKLREHVEFEKFNCRVLKNDERTREFKRKTDMLKNKIYKLRYNNKESIKLTEFGKNASKQSTT